MGPRNLASTRWQRVGGAVLVVGVLLAALGGTVVTGDAANAPSPAAAKEADEIWKSRCATCHGPGGKGDGPAAVALNPKPRDLTLADFQKAVTDAALEKAILDGGPAVGKSPLMPGNPDLKGKPEVVHALRAKVRSFAPQ